MIKNVLTTNRYDSIIQLSARTLAKSGNKKPEGVKTPFKKIA